MKRLVLAALFEILCLSSIYAQSSQNHASNDSEDSSEILQLRYAWFGKFHLVNSEGIRVRSNLKKAAMYDLLSDYTAGKQLYAQYQKTKTLNQVFAYTAIGTTIIGAACILGSLNYSDDNLDVIRSNGLFYSGIGLMGTGMVCTIISIPFGIKAKVIGYKLSSAYNKHQEKYSLNIGATNHGLGVALNF